MDYNNREEAIRLDMANELTMLGNYLRTCSERFYSIGEGIFNGFHPEFERECVLLVCHMRLFSQSVHELVPQFIHEKDERKLAASIRLVNAGFAAFNVYRDLPGGRLKGDNERIFDGSATFKSVPDGSPERRASGFRRADGSDGCAG